VGNTSVRRSTEKPGTSYGGQAVIEGVMMRGIAGVVLSVRGPHGDIVSLTKDAPYLSRKRKLFGLPVLRGALSLWDSLSLGIEMLMRSAEIAAPDEVRPTKTATTLSVVFALIVAVALFMVLPGLLAPWILALFGVTGRLWVSLTESSLRLLILFGYVFLVSRMEEIQRVLEYHGAEHKVVWAWEKNRKEAENLIREEGSSGLPGSLSEGSVSGSPGGVQAARTGEGLIQFLAEKATRESRLHPRCGTSFLFIVVLCTWLVFLFVSPSSTVMKVLIRLALLPLVAGISYEVLKASAGREGLGWRLVRYPGLFLQKLTTREPDMSQLEVAATSLGLLVLKERGESACKVQRSAGISRSNLTFSRRNSTI